MSCPPKKPIVSIYQVDLPSKMQQGGTSCRGRDLEVCDRHGSVFSSIDGAGNVNPTSHHRENQFSIHSTRGSSIYCPVKPSNVETVAEHERNHARYNVGC